MFVWTKTIFFKKQKKSAICKWQHKQSYRCIALSILVLIAVFYKYLTNYKIFSILVGIIRFRD